MTPARSFRRFARDLALYAALAINIACAPIIAMAAEAHEALHATHGEVHQGGTSHDHAGVDGPGSAPTSHDGHGPLDESLHALAHIGHCCGLLSAVAPSSLEVVAAASTCEHGASHDRRHAQQIPAPLLRPPKR
ncbi:MAG TPA: DUF2946 family protein [Steroidobacteraceae bacterium]|nr:DUF2946 family protein [Steroidobacteraceae bacterium]